MNCTPIFSRFWKDFILHKFKFIYQREKKKKTSATGPRRGSSHPIYIHKRTTGTTFFPIVIKQSPVISIICVSAANINTIVHMSILQYFQISTSPPELAESSSLPSLSLLLLPLPLPLPLLPLPLLPLELEV